jgi:hypothetical protein
MLLSVFLAVQTARVGRLEKQLRALMKGAGPGAASMSLGELIAGQGASIERARDEVSTLRHALHTLDHSVARSVQCVGLVRFNPFQDTGGDQSFALALLDRGGDGVVVSSLHSRTGTRFYAKPVKGGTSHLSLSDEEVRAVSEAMSGVKRDA